MFSTDSFTLILKNGNRYAAQCIVRAVNTDQKPIVAFFCSGEPMSFPIEEVEKIELF